MEEHCNDIKTIMAPTPVNCTSILHAGAQYGEEATIPANLIPVPPLDGSRVVSALLPPDKQKYIYFMDRWGFLILLVLALLVLPNILGRIAGSVDQEVLRLVHNQIYGSVPVSPQQQIF